MSKFAKHETITTTKNERKELERMCKIRKESQRREKKVSKKERENNEVRNEEIVEREK